jgi:rhodanese-related sulfurtransferase
MVEKVLIKRSFGILLLVLVLTLIGCSTSSEPTATLSDGSALARLDKNADGYTDITPSQLAEMLSDKDFTMVNVHIPYEGDLPQTDLSIPFDEISNHLDQLPDKDAPIVLYCRSGSMSTTAAKVLADLGYTQVMELDGGFRAWQAAGYSMAGE